MIREVNHDFECEIESAVRAQTGFLIHDLKITQQDDSIIMSGRTNRYYHKQMATQAALKAVGDYELNNEIAVSH